MMRLVLSFVVALFGCQRCPDLPSKEEIAQRQAALADVIQQGNAYQTRLDELSHSRDVLRADIEKLHQDAKVLEAERDQRTVHFVLRVSIRQVSYSLSIRKQLRDAVNEEEFDMPTDRSTYEHVKVGDDLFDGFRAGSALFHGSLGSWRLKVIGKSVSTDGYALAAPSP